MGRRRRIDLTRLRPPTISCFGTLSLIHPPIRFSIFSTSQLLQLDETKLLGQSGPQCGAYKLDPRDHFFSLCFNSISLPLPPPPFPLSHAHFPSLPQTTDTKNFSEYIQKNMELYQLNNNMRLSTHATANFMRREMATALRKGPYQTNILLGGVDESAGASLHFIDMYASCHKVKFGVHGHASNFLLSVFDRMYEEDLSEEQALAIVEKCIAELHTRFLISQPNFVIKVVDAKGVRVIRSPPSL